MIKKIFSVFILFFTIFTFVSASEPMSTAFLRAEEARQRGIDFECPDYFPSDWEDIESQYAAVNNMPKSTQNEMQQASQLYNSVVNAYENLFNKTIPLYTQAWEDEILFSSHFSLKI